MGYYVNPPILRQPDSRAQLAQQSASQRPREHALQERLHTRVVMIFALLAITPLVIGTLISLVIGISITRGQADDEQQRIAATIGAVLGDSWDDTLNDLRLFGHTLDRPHTDPPAEVFAWLNMRCPACQMLWLVDSSGRVLWQDKTSNPPPSLDATTLAVIANGAGAPVPGPAIDGAATSVAIVLPIRQDRALVAQIDIQLLGRQALTLVRPDNEGYGYIIDSQGRLIVSPRPDLAGAGLDLHHIPLVVAAIEGQQWETSRSYAYAGLLAPRVTGVWYGIPNTGWYVLVEAPLAILTADNWYLFALQIVLISLTSAAALVLGRRFAATITRPIEQLYAGVAQLREGHWDQPLVVRRQDEIGQLAEAFNTMAHDLQAKQIAIIARGEELTLANRELQHTLNEARAANVIKSQFVATISHELRTPLTAMLGFADMFEMGVYGQLDNDQLDAITRIRENGQHLLELINDLLDFSKLDAGKLDLREHSFALADLIADTISTCAPQARIKGLTIQFDLAPTLPARLCGDRLRLRQILLNLLSNAIKFTEQGGVSLHVWRYLAGDNHTKQAVTNTYSLDEAKLAHPALPDSIAAAPGRNWLVIEVEDTGLGIAPEHQRVIFDEFRQLDASSTRRAGGTGLGLAITKRLIELMDGKIELISSQGVGSRFTIALPLKPADDPTTTNKGEVNRD